MTDKGNESFSFSGRSGMLSITKDEPFEACTATGDMIASQLDHFCSSADSRAISLSFEMHISTDDGLGIFESCALFLSIGMFRSLSECTKNIYFS